ncbi:MAG TPA: tetratricopeptide repeat protein, partial [Pyrinomonadaceae bacterium]|nr:tetratricopeptide repeat protein [Pyrinomonadaceae bacterium]
MKISYPDRSGWRRVVQASACLPGVRILPFLLFFTILVGPALPKLFSPGVAQIATEPAAPATKTSKAASLVLHEWTERDIAPGEVQYYQVQAAAGQYFSIEIEHWGLKLSGTVSGPTTSESTEFNCRFDDLTPVSTIAVAGGEYVLALHADAGAAKMGRYQIRLQELRSRTEGDNDLLAAEKTLAAADQLRTAQKDDSYRQAIEKYQQELASLKTGADNTLEVYALKDLGRTYESLGDNQSAVAYYQQALSLSRKLKDHRSQAKILNCLSYLNVSIGNNRQALAGAESALRLSRLAAARSSEARALFTSGEAQYGLGDLQKALEFDQQALNILRALRDYRGQAEVLLNVGYAYSSLSRTAESRDAYLEAVSLSRLVHDPRLEAKSLRSLATFQTRLGEYQQALDLFQQSLQCLNLVDDRLTKASVLGGMAFTYKN